MAIPTYSCVTSTFHLNYAMLPPPTSSFCSFIMHGDLLTVMARLPVINPLTITLLAYTHSLLKGSFESIPRGVF